MMPRAVVLDEEAEYDPKFQAAAEELHADLMALIVDKAKAVSANAAITGAIAALAECAIKMRPEGWDKKKSLVAIVCTLSLYVEEMDDDETTIQ